MNGAAEVLVIILSVFLAIFLLLGIILTVYLIKVSREIRDITSSAKRTVLSVESIVNGVSKISSPVFMAQAILKQVNKFKKGKKK